METKKGELIRPSLLHFDFSHFFSTEGSSSSEKLFKRVKHTTTANSFSDKIMSNGKLWRFSLATWLGKPR